MTKNVLSVYQFDFRERERERTTTIKLKETVEMLLMVQVRSVLHMFYNERKQNVIIQLTHFCLHVF